MKSLIFLIIFVNSFVVVFRNTRRTELCNVVIQETFLGQHLPQKSNFDKVEIQQRLSSYVINESNESWGFHSNDIPLDDVCLKVGEKSRGIDLGSDACCLFIHTAISRVSHILLLSLSREIQVQIELELKYFDNKIFNEKISDNAYALLWNDMSHGK
jgi:hypothetical protein